tara:strand:+ start:1872 stop:2084 length:213 start_codon:yes stop_codon:yes gene_type:complete
MNTRIKDKPNLIRDAESGAILNTDINAFNLYKKEKELKEQIISNTNELNNIKNDLCDIKNMLKELLTERK